MSDPLALSQGKLILDVLNKRPVERVPFWFMRQAGRYLPEYRELRAARGGFLDMALDPVSACEVTMQPIRRFGMDAAIIFSDILIVPYALGQRVEFVQGDGPKLNPVREGSEIAALNFNDFQNRTAPVYEALQRTKDALKAEGFNKTALVGFAGSPWTVASYMVEGGSSKDFIAVKMFAYQNPDEFSNLIDLLVESTAAYLTEQINAGAEVIKLFDSWAGILDPDGFNRWVIQPTKRIIELVRDVHPHVPIIGFPKGAGQGYLKYVQETGVNAVAIDPAVSTKWAASSLQSFVPVQGNLDPVCLMAGGDAMVLAVERIVSDLRSGPFIFNLGHGVHKDTPVENVEALVKLLQG